ncbi:MAG TPA: hypothetical protein DDW31_01330 [candidate division Zixibacteria bacterium]|jgi:hypothetical protein|nr:hypothetical protein [candidate division Zixibacteria bacterium]
MKILEKMSSIDRRVIFLLVALAVIIPLVANIGLPSRPGKYTIEMYGFIDRLPAKSQPLLIDATYSPSMMPELQPMLKAILRHCFARKVRVMLMTLDPNGPALCEAALREVAPEYNAVYGEDYVFLGFKPGSSAVIMAIGENVRQAFPADNYGKPLSEFPMMADVRNYADIPLVVSIAGSAITQGWVIYAGTRYHASVGAGCTAVSTADYYPFLQSGQLVGLLNGMKGASEYEWLNQRNGYSTARREAGKGMDAVSIVHLLLMLFIVLGNIGYLAGRRAAQKQ